MARRIFVTGIDTNVGKTIASAALVQALQADYWKPIQTGTERDTEQVQKLVSHTKTQFHEEAYWLKEPVSPHAAAHIEQIQIQAQHILVPQTKNTLVIEGAGGVLVPLNTHFFIIDLIKKIEAETILVVKHYLGSINHTLLSIEALKKRNINILGIIISGEENPASEEIILNQNIKLLGRIYQEKKLTTESIKKYEATFALI
ncbi:MAG: dethiobiotin synthase [Bacteroidetes bacterium]|nr:dethiobiotin synthase [Bacteroidota bacterium]